MWQTALGLVVIQLVLTSAADASQYVPGRYRADGLYVQPHFRVEGDRVGSAEAWYDAMRRDRVGVEVGDAKLPPPVAGSAPGAAVPRERRL